MPAAERTAASTGSGEATSTTEGAQDGNIKQWVGQQLEPIRTAQRDIVKSLNELLDMHGNNKDTNGQLMAKLDKLQVTVDRTLDLHKTDASVQIGEKVGKFQAAVDQSIELHKTAAKTADKLAKDLHELTEISGRRHAATEVATEGTQEQLRGLKRELEATYTSLREPPLSTQGACHRVWETPHGHFAGNLPDEHQAPQRVRRLECADPYPLIRDHRDQGNDGENLGSRGKNPCSSKGVRPFALRDGAFGSSG